MTESMIVTHAWEQFGFKAPFRVVGLWSAPAPSLAEHNPEAYNNALAGAPRCCHGSCAVCGMGIVHHFIIRDSAGTLFAVGGDCVAKTDNTKLVSEMTAIKNKAKREAAQAKRLANHQAELAAAEAEREEQRQRNGGLTDYEIAEKAKRDAWEAKVQAARAEHADLFAALEGSDFGQSILHGFVESGKLPQNKAFSICAEIFAKYHGGRYGSKAYAEQNNRFFDLYDTGE